MTQTLYEEILRSLRQITRAIDLHSRQLSKAYKLTGPQVVCIRHLGHTGKTTPGALSKAVALSQATITGILDRLETQGLIERERDGVDRRRVNVTLSRAGEKLAEKLPVPLQDRFANNLAQLPEENRQIIAAVLQQIVGMMEAENLDADPVLQTGSLINGPEEPA